MAHFEIYLESSGNFIAGGADLISISDLLSRELCTPRGSILYSYSICGTPNPQNEL